MQFLIFVPAGFVLFYRVLFSCCAAAALAVCWCLPRTFRTIKNRLPVVFLASPSHCVCTCCQMAAALDTAAAAVPQFLAGPSHASAPAAAGAAVCVAAAVTLL